MSGADLAMADLRSADLTGAEELTQGQLEPALGDETTKLPKALHPPPSWTQGEDGQTEGKE